MDDKPPVLKIKTEKLDVANKVLIASFILTILAVILQKWLQALLFISLPTMMATGMYEVYVRYKRIVKKESVAPDWNKVSVRKEIPHEMGAGTEEPPDVELPNT